MRKCAQSKNELSLRFQLALVVVGGLICVETRGVEQAS